jgi:hypothetical protein
MQCVDRFIRGCIICCTDRTNNGKKELYHPSWVPTRPWENIYMDFVCGLQITRKGRVYLFVVVEKFRNMFILMHCNKTIWGNMKQTCFLKRFWCTLGYQGASS